MGQESRLRNINETRSCFLKKVERNELMSRNYEKICTTLNYIEHFLILASAVTGFISIFASALFFGFLFFEFCKRIKICVIVAGIKSYRSEIKKKKKHNRIVLLSKSIN